MFIKSNKDNNLRFKYCNIEKKKFLLEYLMYNKKINFNKRFIYALKFYKKKNLFVKTKIVNRCIFSGRSRGINKKFKISRHFFKSMSNKGLLRDVFKNS